MCLQVDRPLEVPRRSEYERPRGDRDDRGRRGGGGGGGGGGRGGFTYGAKFRSDRGAVEAQAAAESVAKKVDYSGLIIDYSDI